MSIFLFTVMFGFMACVSSYLGITAYFIGIVIIGFVVQFIKERIDVIEIDKEPENKVINNLVTKLNEERAKQNEELTKKASQYDFIGKHQIPVKVNKDTNTYVIDVNDLVMAIDRYYSDIEKDAIKK